MSRVSTRRADLLSQLLQAGRLNSTATIMLHQAVADRLGLNPTDHKCVDLLCMHGPKTAGELADLTGLTTGAITSVIDRLESANFVRREDDPNDRRRVVIRIVPNCPQKIGRMFESLRQSMIELTARYTDRELETIIDFMTRSRQIAHEETIKLRKGIGKGR